MYSRSWAHEPRESTRSYSPSASAAAAAPLPPPPVAIVILPGHSSLANAFSCSSERHDGCGSDPARRTSSFDCDTRFSKAGAAALAFPFPFGASSSYMTRRAAGYAFPGCLFRALWSEYSSATTPRRVETWPNVTRRSASDDEPPSEYAQYQSVHSPRPRTTRVSRSSRPSTMPSESASRSPASRRTDAGITVRISRSNSNGSRGRARLSHISCERSWDDASKRAEQPPQIETRRPPVSASPTTGSAEIRPDVSHEQRMEEATARSRSAESERRRSSTAEKGASSADGFGASCGLGGGGSFLPASSFFNTGLSATPPYSPPYPSAFACFAYEPTTSAARRQAETTGIDIALPARSESCTSVSRPNSRRSGGIPWNNSFS